MATNGEIKTTTAFGYIKLVWTLESQSIENNTSTISYYLQIYRSSKIVSSAQKDYWIKINGVTVKSGSITIGGGVGGAMYGSGTTTIPHNADGTKTFDLSFSQEIAITWSGSWIGTVTGSGTGTLTTIPRATTPSFHTSSIDFGSTITIYTPRASSNFTHILDYKIGGLSGRIATGVETYHYWLIPKTLMSAIPNATSGVITITCHTYNGSTYLGSKSATFTATVPTSSDTYPTIDDVTITEGGDSAIATLFGAFVQDQSKANVTITASGAYGSTIKSYKTVLCGVTYTTASFISNTISAHGNVVLTISVTDTRGRSISTTKTITVLAYTRPKIETFICNRVDSTGAIVDEGECLSAQIKFSVTDLNQKNGKYYSLYYKEKDSSDEPVIVANGNVYSLDTEIISSEAILSPDKQYDITLFVQDFFADVYAFAAIGTAFNLINIGADGKSLALGKMVENGGFEVGLDTMFENTPQIRNAKILWQGEDVMAAGKTITLSDSVSNQMFGISLVFARYNADNGQYMYISSFFVPKALIKACLGMGHSFMMTSEYSYMCSKYLYINDTTIIGHSINTTDKGSQAATGFIFNNSIYKLLYVLGV